MSFEEAYNENLGQGPSGKGPKSKAALLPSELRLLGVLPGWRRNSEHTDHGEEADEEFFATGARNHAKCREAQEKVQERLAIW